MSVAKVGVLPLFRDPLFGPPCLNRFKSSSFQSTANGIDKA